MRAANLSMNALSLRRVLVGGEPFQEETRRKVEEALHVTVTDNYAVSELLGPGVAAECLERNGLHLNEDHFLPEIVDPVTLAPLPPGAEGELVLTSLTKEAFPLIRFRTRDLTTLDMRPCPCGRSSARIKRMEARTDDMLIIKGVNLFPAQVEAVLADVARTALRFQLVVERREALDVATVLVEVSEAVFFDEMRRQAGYRDLLRHRLASDLGVTFEVKLVDRSTMDGLVAKGKVVDLRRR